MIVLLRLLLGCISCTTTVWSAFTPRGIANTHGRRAQRQDSLQRQLSSTESNAGDGPLQGLKVTVVGGGPSGLLLTHRLLSGGASHVSLYESRPRPGGTLESRAYALGIGIRGRTAIKSVDERLWEDVKEAGFLSERFQLHVGPFVIPLRSEKDGENIAGYEPSLLSYQSELCRVMADQLEERWSSDRLKMCFDCKVTSLDLESKTVTTSENSKTESFDLIVGCDGVRSIVRESIARAWPDFEAHSEIIPGDFQVVRIPKMPPGLNPTAGALLIPKAGTCTAFVEPTYGGEACILFAGRNASDTLLASQNITELKRSIVERFPKLDGADLDAAATQLASMQPSKASVVTCNIYHYGATAALVGDAAHATGGVSGQGVNSALMDASVLADCLMDQYDSGDTVASLRNALLAYSKKQVPEGKALYELSFGPKPTSFGKRLGVTASSALDFLFKGRFGIGRLPLQTLLTTSLQPFAEIRRDLGTRYDDDFPDEVEWGETITNLDAKATTSTSAAQSS